MSEEPLFKKSRTDSHEGGLASALIRWKGSIIVVIIAFLLAVSGFTIFTFITMLQKDPPEKRGVEFPFDGEIVIPLPYSEESGYENPSNIIKNTVRRNSLNKDFIEIVLQREDNPLFINEILKDKNSLPKEMRSQIKGFSMGSKEGVPFFLLSFNNSAFPVLSKHSKELFSSMSYFTGRTSTREAERQERENTTNFLRTVKEGNTVYGYLKELFNSVPHLAKRASTKEAERLKRANTLVILRDGNTVYGYLDKNTVAITESKDVFLDILKRYRSI
ncbi:MAG: hypothetical protein ACQESA_00620 [Patescibacteria group bacterium]